MKIGLALGSGGARGIAHLGVLKAIEKHGLTIDYISGSSMGAFVGAAYSAGVSLEKLEEIAISSTWQFAAKKFIPSLSKSGFVDGAEISKFLYEVIGVNSFEDLNIPLAIETTDLETGECITITQGELIPAIRASVAVPIILTPKIINDRVLVDGGLVSPIPIQTVRDMGADFIIAVDVMASPKTDLTYSENGYLDQIMNTVKQNKYYSILTKNTPINRHQKKSVNIINVFMQTLSIGHSKVAEYQIKLEKPDILIQPETFDFSSYDFHKGKELIDNAYGIAIESLKQLRK
jgi:NTE family protein